MFMFNEVEKRRKKEVERKWTNDVQTLIISNKKTYFGTFRKIKKLFIDSKMLK